MFFINFTCSLGAVVVLRSTFFAYYRFCSDDTTIIMTIQYRIIIDIITTFFVKTDVMHLCGITLDRYLSIFYALRYQTVVNSKTIRRYIITSWFLPLMTSSLQFTWLYPLLLPTDSDNSETMNELARIEIWYSLCSFILFLAIPMVLLAYAYVSMFREIRRLMLQLPGNHVVEMAPKQRRVITIFCTMYVTIVILALPYFTLRLYIDVRAWLALPINISRSIVYLAIVLQNLTSIVNPLLYTTSASDVKSLVREIAVISVRGIRKFSTDAFRKFSSSTRVGRKVGRAEVQPFIQGADVEGGGGSPQTQRPSRVRKMGIAELRQNTSYTDVTLLSHTDAC